MKSIVVSTRIHKELHLVLVPMGYRSSCTKTGALWCEPEQRPALRKAIETAKGLTAEMTKAQLADALRKLGVFVSIASLREEKVGLATRLEIALVDAWIPEKLV